MDLETIIDWIIGIAVIWFNVKDCLKGKSEDATSTNDTDASGSEQTQNQEQAPLTTDQQLIRLKAQMQLLNTYSNQKNRQLLASPLLGITQEQISRIENYTKDETFTPNQLKIIQSWLFAIEEITSWLGSNAFLIHQKIANDLLAPIYASRPENQVFFPNTLKSNLCLQELETLAKKNHFHFIFHRDFFSLQPLVDLIRSEVHTVKDQSIDIKTQMILAQRQKDALYTAYWTNSNLQDALGMRRPKLNRPYLEGDQVHWHIDQAFEFWTAEFCVTAISFLLFEKVYLEQLALEVEQEDAFRFNEKLFQSGLIPAFLKLDLIDVLCQKLRLNTDILYGLMASNADRSDPVYLLPNQKNEQSVQIPRQVFIKKLSNWVDLFLDCQIIHLNASKIKDLGMISGISLAGNSQLGLTQLVSQKYSNHEDLKKNAILIFEAILDMDVSDFNQLSLDIQLTDRDRAKQKQKAYKIKANVEEAFEESVEEIVEEGAFKHFEHSNQKEINEREALEKDMYSVNTKIENMEEAELAEEMDYSHSYELETEHEVRVQVEKKLKGGNKAKGGKKAQGGHKAKDARDVQLSTVRAQAKGELGEMDDDFIFALSIPDFFDRKARRV
jgi:hypothetical protein